MKLGAFSVSLNVKDIHKSKAFYEKLGFEDFDDVRKIQMEEKSQGIKPESEADENSTGPASFVVIDSD